MSIQKVALVLDESQSTGTARNVLLSIANHDGDGGAWPSMATIMFEANCSESSYHRAIAALVEAGELKVHVNRGGTVDWDPRYRPNRYEILLTKGSRRRPSRGSQSDHPFQDPGVVNLVGRGGQSDSPGVVRLDTQTVQEPPTEPSTLSPTPQSDLQLVAAEVPAPPDHAWLDFWREYPRKVKQPQAVRAWRNQVVKPGVDPQHVLAGLARWKDYWKLRNQPEFIPHPASWLNGHCWNDPVPEYRPQPARGPVLSSDPVAALLANDVTGDGMTG